MPTQLHYTIAIVGAGSAGLSVAARLLRQSKAFQGSIGIIDPQMNHYYQPLWTLVGGGVVKKETTSRSLQSLIPKGADWIQEAVAQFQPSENQIVTAGGTVIKYDALVVAAGIQVDWDRIKGLKECIGQEGVCSNYDYRYVDSTWESIHQFRGGNAIFTHPSTPIKCGGAPQKIMYLADDAFRQMGVRGKTNIIFASGNASIFAVPKYAAALDRVVERKGITTKYKMNLIEIRADKREAVFEHVDTKEQETMKYDMLHVVPPMSAPSFIQNSPLSGPGGWVEVDKHSLQHVRFENVFALGDCSNLPTSKTGAAIRKQAPVAARNIINWLAGQPLDASYDGYTSCPLVTGYNRLILAEFDYQLTPRETFPFDQSKERYSMYVLKKDLLPKMYWHGMLKGRM
ncbi:FAD/NAD(P)-binding oxidoreductase [Paenibacillus alvei]|uniref:FAD/NAD(P)-binding oxidoreductase n=1 Tax=Paenibacillus alvei TaxID=44250 RepID=UPI0013DC7738|nr:FAD/NAD(P)-binding oxidoreductase [Paenibacillus alvei]MBG9733394.1 pyridine nucleotide-disulfide oxidoreductase [Paenibacillus alvei]MBG9742751.1 pyridine nucleotide-disulfide oxidoreductase [Paenibacillus alvei]MCY9581418.1 NAD(P)/FAD-dependent oxidoreductase [Paenibacillus alvei]MCY9585574.1 NAD(P)/FAD-dependent oxidoreductase [Paenibacillus alvei]NEZ41885.1 pyridine nucleotide-disulfide oxidoreductase [Paenibacillus alvei]